MARYTLDQLERLAVGQGDSISTSQYQDGADTSRHLIWMQPTIYARIMDALIQSDRAITRLEIARALGLKKTPWLVQAIERLVTDGYVTRIESRTPQGVIMWLYEVARN